MFTTDRRSLILGSAAVVAFSALSRSYAESATGPYKLDPLPYSPEIFKQNEIFGAFESCWETYKRLSEERAVGPA